MIFGIDPVTAASSALLWVGLGSCAPQTAPAVEIVFENATPARNNTLSHRALGGFKADTQFSHARNEIFLTGGLTRSSINTGFNMSLKSTKNTVSGESCLWIDSIKITVSYAPTVYIAKDYAQGSCHYRETLQHEIRHVNTDIITINEYLPLIKSEIAAASAALGVQGPVAADSLKAAQDKMGQAVSTALKSVSDKMNAARMARQQQIDTRQEYLRLGKVCGGKP